MLDINYDVNIEVEELFSIEDNLKRIQYCLNDSVNKMETALIQSQDFLAGRQFEKVMENTQACMNIVEQTNVNLSQAIKYISSLEEILEEYKRNAYLGDE